MADFELSPDFSMEAKPKYKTSISEFENGVEQRRALWETKLRQWTLFFKNRNSTDLSTILTLFDTYKGSYGSFTWLNPIDAQTYTVRFGEDELRYVNKSYDLFDIELTLIEVK